MATKTVTYKGGGRRFSDHTDSGETETVPKDATEVIVDPSVAKIDDYAFYGCVALTTIHIPTSVESIGNSAFENCTALVSIDIPTSVKSIGNSAFTECRTLSNIRLSDLLTTIGIDTFSRCTSLSTVIIPQNVKNIGSYAFQHCKSISTVYLPNTIDVIGFDAFSDCPLLESIHVYDPHSLVVLKPEQLMQPNQCNEVIANANNANIATIPFNHLERVYKKRKLEETTVDLTRCRSDDVDNAPKTNDGNTNALRAQVQQRKQYQATLVKVKEEKVAAEECLEDTKDDLDDANDTLAKQSAMTDIWRQRFEEVAVLAQRAGVDENEISSIRNRSLASWYWS